MDTSNVSVNILWSHKGVNRLVPLHLYNNFQSIQSYCHNIVSHTDFCLAYKYKSIDNQEEDLILLSKNEDLKTALRVLSNRNMSTLNIFSVQEDTDGGGLVVLGAKSYLCASTLPERFMWEVSQNGTSPGPSSVDSRSTSTQGLYNRISDKDKSSEKCTFPLLEVKSDSYEFAFIGAEIEGSTLRSARNPSPLPVFAGDTVVFSGSLPVRASNNEHQNLNMGLFQLPMIDLGSAGDALSFESIDRPESIRSIDASIDRPEHHRRYFSPIAPTEGYLDSSAEFFDEEIEDADLFERNRVKAENIEIDKESNTIPPIHTELQQNQACSSTSQNKLLTDADTVLQQCYYCTELGLNPRKIRELQDKRNHVKKHYRVEKSKTPPPEDSQEFMKELANCFPSSAVGMGHFEDNSTTQLPSNDSSSHVVGPMGNFEDNSPTQLPSKDSSSHVVGSIKTSNVDPNELRKEAGSTQTFSLSPRPHPMCNICQCEISYGSLSYHLFKEHLGVDFPVRKISVQ